MQSSAANRTGSFTSMNDSLGGRVGNFFFFSLIYLSWKAIMEGRVMFYLEGAIRYGNGNEPEFLVIFPKFCFFFGSVPDRVTDLHF